MARPRIFNDEMREALIRDTAEQITTGGLESVSLRPLAAKHGCSTTAIYTMFGSRDALIDAVSEEAVASFSRSQDSVPITDDPWEDLMELGRQYRRWAVEHPGLYGVVFGTGGRRPNGTIRVVRKDGDGVRKLSVSAGPLHRRVQNAKDAGVLAECPAGEIEASLWAGIHGWMALELNEPLRLFSDLAQGYEFHMRALLRGWTPRALGETD